MDEQDRDEDEGGRPVAALIGLIVIVLLVLGGLWLSRLMHRSAEMQDCLASGRTNCAPLSLPARP